MEEGYQACFVQKPANETCQQHGSASSQPGGPTGYGVYHDTGTWLGYMKAVKMPPAGNRRSPPIGGAGKQWTTKRQHCALVNDTYAEGFLEGELAGPRGSRALPC